MGVVHLARRRAVLVLVATLVVWVRPLAGSDEIDQRLAEESPALSLEMEVRRLATQAAREGSLWPGFEPLAVPLAVYDGVRTFLFRHPAPPPGFTAAPGDAPALFHAWHGRHEAIVANTSAEIGGVPTATVLLDPPGSGRSLRDLAAVAIHEAFHVHQRARHPGWIGNEADVFTYPSDAVGLLALRRLETEALRQALTAADAAAAACWARRALALRGERYAGMEPAFAAYERGTELNEGLATYVEMRAAGRREVDLPPAEFRPSEVRRRAYVTGRALALLLDRFAAGWPGRFEADDHQTLDAALAAVLGPGAVCAFDEHSVAAAAEKARADVAALMAERTRRLEEFEAKPGWRVIVEASGGDPLWPQEFDPLNIVPLAGARVLHTRFLRLGNGAGRLEILNAEALTEGVGSHPLFQGVRRVVLTGLAQPEFADVDGKVTLRAPGLTAEFDGASVVRSGDLVTVRLGS